MHPLHPLTCGNHMKKVEKSWFLTFLGGVCPRPPRTPRPVLIQTSLNVTFFFSRKELGFSYSVWKSVGLKLTKIMVKLPSKCTKIMFFSVMEARCIQNGDFFKPPPQNYYRDWISAMGVSDGQDFLFWGSFDCFELILNIILMSPPLHLAPPPLKVQKIT